MKAGYCPYRGGRAKRNGKTSSGSRRWRRTARGASTTVRCDDTATRCRRGRCSPTSPPPCQGRPAAVDQQHDRGRGELAAGSHPAQPPGADVGQVRKGGVPVVPRAPGGREDGAREARHDADRRGHRLPVQRLPRLAVARGRRAGVGRKGRVGGSTTGTRTRSGWINGLKRMFYRDTHFVL